MQEMSTFLHFSATFQELAETVAEKRVSNRDDIVLGRYFNRDRVAIKRTNRRERRTKNRFCSIRDDKIVNSIHDFFNTVINRPDKIDVIFKASAELSLELLFILK